MIDEPMEWQVSRAAAADELERQATNLLCSVLRREWSEIRLEMFELDRQRERILTWPGWMPERPARRMASARKVAEYWHLREPFYCDVDIPECFCCHLLAPFGKWQHLQRAHLVDRWQGGLDNEHNLAMLCRFCHGSMPGFGIDEWDGAAEYVLSVPSWIGAVS